MYIFLRPQKENWLNKAARCPVIVTIKIETI